MTATDRLALRPMTVGDVLDVLDVQEPGAVVGLSAVFPQELYPFPRDVIGDRWRTEIADPSRECFVITVAGAVVGFAATRGAEFSHFGVAVDRWGSGVAQAAHDLVIASIRAGGHDVAWLDVYELNPRGRRFYEKLGWRATGQRSNGAVPPHAELLRYELLL